MSFIIGLLMVAIGSFTAGTSAWPFKTAKKYDMEHVIFFSQIVGMGILPWIIMCCLCNIGEAFQYIGFKNLLIANIFSFIFGIGNILGIICLVKIGFVMNSILAGVTSLIIATLTPLVFKGSGIFSQAPDLNSPSGIMTILAVIVMVVSIILISKAGGLRDEQLGKMGVANLTKKQSSFYKFLAVLAGFFAPGLLFLNTYYGPVLKNAVSKAGCMEPLVSLSLWTFGMFGCILLCAGYSLYLILKNGTFKNSFDLWEFLRATCSGVQYVVYLILFGFGSIIMGPLGASIGNGVSSCGSTGGQQFIGFAFGEWKGVKGKPIKLFIIGISFLLVGIILLSLSSYFNNP